MKTNIAITILQKKVDEYQMELETYKTDRGTTEATKTLKADLIEAIEILKEKKKEEKPQD